jgi:excisionase family DNA binding protein
MALSNREIYRVTLRKYPDLLNVEQISGILGVSTKTVYKMIRNGELSYIKTGREYRIPKVTVLQYMNLLQKSAI